MSEKIEMAPIRAWTAEPLSTEVERALKRLARTESVLRIAVMPDVHLARGVCIGTVFASDGRIFPEAVGNDIGCGMTAVRLEASACLLDDAEFARKLLKGFARVVPAKRHPLGGAPDWLPERLGDERLSSGKLSKKIRRDGSMQFGTLGRGNHFLELQADAEGQLWIMVHSGSRAMGQSIAEHHLDLAQRSNSGLLYLDADSDEGRAYQRDAEWAVDYARENRGRIIDSAAMLLEELCGVQVNRESLFDSVHNFVRLETHSGQEVYLHRKGACSAAEGELSIIPGSMGTASYHVVGRGKKRSLSSCSHGAGRAMSRSEARIAISEKRLKRAMHGILFDSSRASTFRDEAPEAYKEIDSVMRAQSDLVGQVRRLRPLLNHKG